MGSITLKKYSSPVGNITIAAENDAITGLWIEGQKYFCETCRFTTATYKDDYALDSACSWLDRYFAGDRPAPDELNLNPQGSEFRKAVWNILRQIPYGETMTYGDIAQRISTDYGMEHMSAQAVGGAVGHNPISIIVPCHRVVGAGGSMTGYAGGIDKKVALLRHEGIIFDERNNIIHKEKSKS